MVIEFAAREIARWVKRNNPTSSTSVEIFEYFLLLRLNFWSVIVICSIIGLTTGKLEEMAAAMAGFWFLRVVSGGFHFSSMTVCVVATVIILTAVTFIRMGVVGTAWVTLTSLILTFIFSTKSLDVPLNIKPYLRVTGIWIVTSNFIVLSPHLALAFLAQSLLLINLRR